MCLLPLKKKKEEEEEERSSADLISRVARCGISRLGLTGWKAFGALTIYPAWLIWPALPEKGGGCSPRCHSATPPDGKEPCMQEEEGSGI